MDARRGQPRRAFFVSERGVGGTGSCWRTNPGLRRVVTTKGLRHSGAMPRLVETPPRRIWLAPPKIPHDTSDGLIRKFAEGKLHRR